MEKATWTVKKGLAEMLKGGVIMDVVTAEHARIAEEEGRFDIHDVARTLAEKLVRRHPHVFADVRYDSEAEHHAAWELEKARERVEAGAGRGHLDGVALALPALTRAVKLQKRAARVGFDWDRPGPVLAKVLEEFDELRAEIEADAPEARLGDEVGDLLFSVCNLARHLGVAMDEIMAIGDGTNDVSLLESVGLGVAMGNACDELKAVAGHVTLDVDHSGLAAAVDRFLL